MAQGKQVDILYQTDAYYFELADSAKLQYDMTELVKKRGINLNAIEPQVLESLRKSGGGKLYAAAGQQLDAGDVLQQRHIR